MQGKNRYFSDVRLISPKQVELAIYMRMFRRINYLSQEEMAELCTIYGESKGIKFRKTDISDYENYKRAPRQKQFQILLNTMKITPEVLEK